MSSRERVSGVIIRCILLSFSGYFEFANMFRGVGVDVIVVGHIIVRGMEKCGSFGGICQWNCDIWM